MIYLLITSLACKHYFSFDEEYSLYYGFGIILYPLIIIQIRVENIERGWVGHSRILFFYDFMNTTDGKKGIVYKTAERKQKSPKYIKSTINAFISSDLKWVCVVCVVWWWEKITRKTKCLFVNLSTSVALTGFSVRGLKNTIFNFTSIYYLLISFLFLMQNAA